MIVEKAVNMANIMKVPILGIVENMSYFMCPNCNEKHKIFGESHIEEVAKKNNTKVLAKLPMDPDLAKAVDKGQVEDYAGDYMNQTAEEIEKACPIK